MSQVRIVADLEFRTKRRTGLFPGTVIEIEPREGPERGQVWVHCPPVELPLKNGGYEVASVGYVILEANEIEYL